MAKKRKMYRQNPRIRQVLNEGEAEQRNGLKEKDVKPVEKCWVVAENRIGTFLVSAALMEFVEWGVYQEFIKNFMVTGVNLSPDKRMFQFLAFSPLFDKLSRLEPNVKPPQYHINVDVRPPQKEGNRKKVTVTAEKLEESKIVGIPRGTKIKDASGKEIKL